MKKYFKKLLIGFLSIVILGITPVLGTLPLYAADQKPILKLEDAIQSAFVRNNQVSLNSKEQDLLREQLKAMQGGSFVAYQTIYLTKAKNEQQAQIIREQIAYDITNRYNALVLLEKEIANLDNAITINTNKLQNASLKSQIGLISSFEYNNAVIQLDMQKTTRAAKYKSLTHDKDHFKTLTGKNPDHYLLDDTLNYEPFRIPGATDRYFNTIIAEYLKYDKDLIALQEDNILVEGAPGMPWSVYLAEKYKVEAKLSAVESSETALKQALATSYSSLLSLEEQISTLNDQLKLLKNQLEILTLQHEVGLITALDYKSQALTLQDTECTLRKLINNYTSLKLSIQKPWVSSGGR